MILKEQSDAPIIHITKLSLWPLALPHLVLYHLAQRRQPHPTPDRQSSMVMLWETWDLASILFRQARSILMKNVIDWICGWQPQACYSEASSVMNEVQEYCYQSHSYCTLPTAVLFWIVTVLMTDIF